jgi:hypothetical protein
MIEAEEDILWGVKTVCKFYINIPLKKDRQITISLQLPHGNRSNCNIPVLDSLKYFHEPIKQISSASLLVELNDKLGGRYGLKNKILDK